MWGLSVGIVAEFVGKYLLNYWVLGPLGFGGLQVQEGLGFVV